VTRANLACVGQPGETRTQHADTDALLAELQDALDALHTIRMQIAEWEQQHDLEVGAAPQFHRASNAISIAASSGNTQRSNTTHQGQATSSR